jgi:hypothetical protein
VVSRVSTGTGNLGGKWTFLISQNCLTRFHLSQLGEVKSKAACANYPFKTLKQIFKKSPLKTTEKSLNYRDSVLIIRSGAHADDDDYVKSKDPICLKNSIKIIFHDLCSSSLSFTHQKYVSIK